ncbi:unnamed protein product [Blepharisma stoltei]|uniref:Vesicle transport protein n=1 Tax=Blepharisma stoltei TaxID=1481888 RepID=A0AAU9KBH0_9CILI|nr:unnamed protein product [Blepharisma stoltei]
MANFDQVLQNLSFYDNKKEKSTWSGWLSGYWNKKNPTDKDKDKFFDNLAASIKTKGAAGLSVFQSAANRTYRIKNFFLFLLLSIGLFIGAFMFLPMVLLFPQKFALMFSLASLCMQIAMSYLKPNSIAYMKCLFYGKDNLKVSLAYFISLLWTIYSAIILRSYIWVCISSSIQFLALLWFLFSMVPGGTSGFITLLKYSFKLCPCMPTESLLPL